MADVQLIESVRSQATARFSAPVHLVCAPARVNLIGEHTDYNNGLVLPTTTALHTCMSVSEAQHGAFRVYSAQYDEQVTFSADELAPGEPLHWSNYVKGVVWALREADVSHTTGVDIYVDGNIPLGKGLSSSASLTVATCLALAHQTLDPLPLAQLARRAEVEFVGLNCGIMDQLTVAACPEGSVICIDCGDLSWQNLPLPQKAQLLLVDSGVRHQLPEGQYNDRADECRQIADHLGVDSLRETDHTQLAELNELQQRRARHVLSENQRVRDACRALNHSDTRTLGTLFNESHTSLRDDYQVSCDEVDVLQAIAAETPGVYGARMVGAGFGGCVLALVDADQAEVTANNIAERFSAHSGTKPWWHLAAPTSPAGFVS